MNKAELCNVIRSKYPKAFGIRKKLQKLKVKRLIRYTLAVNEISLCEKDPSKKKNIVDKYSVQWKDVLKPIVLEMEEILEKSPVYHNRIDVETIRTDMLFCRMAYGFLPSEYVGFELENKLPEERKMFISDIETLQFGYSVNDITVLQSIVDKGKSFHMFGQYFGRDAVSIDKKTRFSDFHTFVSEHPTFVKKKTNSSQGKNIELVDIRKNGKSEEEYFASLVASGRFLLEEIVIQNNEMAKFNESSVNTVRCMTMKTQKGVCVPYCFMRTGRKGSFVDNGGAGGILIGIDVKTGCLNTDGYDEYMQRFEKHPDTKIKFKGKQIPEWEAMINFCKFAASKVEGIGYLSWDMAYTDRGWIVIEVNGIGQLIGPQIVMKKGIKSEIKEISEQMHLVI